MKKQLQLKKSLLGLLLATFSFHQTNAQPAARANVYSFNFKGKKYEIIKEKKTWADAAQSAKGLGAYLVHIDSLSEQTAVYAAVVASGVPTDYHPAADGGGTSYIWIGATDKNAEGAWLWDGDNDNAGINFWNGQGANGTNNGAVVAGKFVNWGGKSAGTIEEPDNYYDNQDAGAIALTGWPSGSTSLGIAGEWNDIDITNTLYYIVEYDNVISVKETAPESRLIKIFPNPSADQLQISAEQPLLNAHIKLVTITGQSIIEKTNVSGNSLNLDISKLAQGIYFLELNQKGTLERIRFIKN